MISKLESIAQSDPIPNGYGTVTLPHCFGHPGFAIFGAFVIVVGDTGLSAVGWAEIDVKIVSREQVNEKNRAICLCCMVGNFGGMYTQPIPNILDWLSTPRNLKTLPHVC